MPKQNWFQRATNNVLTNKGKVIWIVVLLSIGYTLGQVFPWSEVKAMF
jgi:membrane protein DedA with SNARE-associated domain